jgi:hypothetical protein
VSFCPSGSPASEAEPDTEGSIVIVCQTFPVPSGCWSTTESPDGSRPTNHEYGIAAPAAAVLGSVKLIVGKAAGATTETIISLDDVITWPAPSSTTTRKT